MQKGRYNKVSVLLKIIGGLVGLLGIIHFAYYIITIHPMNRHIFGLIATETGVYGLKALLVYGFGELIEQVFQSNQLKKELIQNMKG